MSISRSLLVALVLCLIASQPVAARVNVGCRACLVVDDDGRVIFERNADERLPNASTTKMVTALVALENLDPDDVVTVPRAVLAVGGGTLDLHPRDRFIVEDMLLAMMLDSSNDAAITLAHAVSGSERAFVTEMNSFVEGLGLEDTRFVTSHGLDEPGHYSSARDLATIGDLLLANDVLAGIVARGRATITTPQGSRRIENRNVLLETYEGAIGIKTGYTLAARYVLVAAARRHGRTVTAVVMGSSDSFADAAALLNRGFRRLARDVVAPVGRPTGVLMFGDLSSTPVALASAVRGPFHPNAVSFDLSPKPGLELPVARGESVGMIELTVDGSVVDAVAARALADVGAAESSWATSFFAGILGLFEPLAGPS